MTVWLLIGIVFTFDADGALHTESLTRPFFTEKQCHDKLKEIGSPDSKHELFVSCMPFELRNLKGLEL